MIKKVVILIMVISLGILNPSSQDAYAGGSGGEPLMSDAVGWGLVGAMVIVGIYFIYTTRQEVPTDKEKPKDSRTKHDHVQTAVSRIVTTDGSLIIAQW